MDHHEAFMFLMRENLHRENVHPLDEADYFQHLITAGSSLDDILTELGKSLAYVHQRLRLLKLTKPLRARYQAGKIGHAVALAIATLEPATQQELARWLGDRLEWDGGVSLANVRDWIQRNAALSMAAAPFNANDATLWAAAGPCTTCPKRTGNTPSLFGELGVDDSCTDRKCWEQKVEKHIARTIKAWDADGVEWTPLSKYHQGNVTQYKGKPMRIGFDKLSKAKGGQAGIIVRGYHPDLGTITYWTPQSFRHGPAQPKSPQERAAAARVKRQQKITAAHRQAVFDAVAKVTPKGPDDLAFIALNVYDGLWLESQKKLARYLGWELEKQKNYNGFDAYKTAEKRLAVLSGPEILRFLHACAIIKEVDRGQGYRAADHLMQRAKVLKINTAKLLKDAEAKFPPVKAPKRTAKKARHAPK
jgi:hypothetical protein